MGKYLHQSKPKVNIPVRIAAVLFCLTLFSTYLVGGLFARYTASGQSGDEARVAKFSIEGSGTLSQSIVQDFKPGDSEELTFTITNNSEVAVEYTVTAAIETKNLPLSMSMKKGDATVAGATHTETQLPGSHTNTYTLHIEWNKDAANAKDPDMYMGRVDYISIKVTAVQID